MVKENNCNDGNVKLFPKIIGIASLLKNEPSTLHRSENLASPRSNLHRSFENNLSGFVDVLS